MGCSSAVCSLYDETITVTLLVVDECDNHAKALLVEFASCRFCQFKFLLRSFPTLIFYRSDRYAAAGHATHTTPHQTIDSNEISRHTIIAKFLTPPQQTQR